MEYVIFFDMDGVLTPQAQALQLAQEMGKKKDFLRLFAGQLRKQVGLEWILSKGAQFLKGQDDGILKRTAQKMTFTPSAKPTIDALVKASYRPVIVTNGFQEMAEVFGARMGIKEAYGNAPESRDGILTGEIADGPLVTIKSKGDFVRNYLKDKGIEKSHTVAVGNDENDIFMFREVGLSIAFNPSASIKNTIKQSFSKAMDGDRREFLKLTKEVDIVVLQNDLSKILPFLVPRPDKFSKQVRMDEKTMV